MCPGSSDDKASLDAHVQPAAYSLRYARKDRFRDGGGVKAVSSGRIHVALSFISIWPSCSDESADSIGSASQAHSQLEAWLASYPASCAFSHMV